MDPITILMFGLIAVMIFFMFRNGKKRQAAMQELQNNLRPGAEVMLQSGIFGTLDSIDEENNRATVISGTSTIVVHRNAITQVVTPAEGVENEAEQADLAPDDDPAFGERVAGVTATDAATDAATDTAADAAEAAPADDADQSNDDKPKA